ncbi:vascular-related unknown protein 1-like isoform X2 [Salvia splendens]|uniref:vascular-related unknown protein 1-like isoform X2 n=1 Tax=Salvia splendens TaxID=180675 RepID=UPI001C27C883|nr:vascular-related unknown protein 1-like isoform X2 [Salvia splendens]
MAMNSSINDKNIEEEEESGWTQYLEDFSCNRDSFISSSSMVSDAAWNGSSDTIKQLNLKKLNRRRKNTYEYDDALEDTASSPVHSPKVSTMMKQMEVNHRKMDESNSKNFLKPEREERNTKNIVIDNETSDQYMELRKRGLCLVPMSALINYIG